MVGLWSDVVSTASRTGGFECERLGDIRPLPVRVPISGLAVAYGSLSVLPTPAHVPTGLGSEIRTMSWCVLFPPQVQAV